MFNETKTHEITVDVVILTIINNAIQVLLVKRMNEPFKDKWAIPGGYVRLSENLDQAALRVLKERTNVDNIYLEQLYTFGDPLRHPNARVITCAYFALVRAEDIKIVSSPELGWHKVSNLPPLAFDHKEIIQYSLKRTRERLELCPVIIKRKIHTYRNAKILRVNHGEKTRQKEFQEKSTCNSGAHRA